MCAVYTMMFVCLFVWFISSKVFNNTRTLENAKEAMMRPIAL